MNNGFYVHKKVHDVVFHISNVYKEGTNYFAWCYYYNLSGKLLWDTPDSIVIKIKDIDNWKAMK